LVDRFAGSACEFRMVFTDYVTAGLAEQLQAQSIWFADVQGNVSLTIPGKLVLHVAGNRPPAAVPTKGQHYSVPGAKVLHYLLKHGPRIGATYRDVRRAVGVSIDKIGRLIRELETTGIVRVLGRGDFQVTNGDALLRQWVDAYEAKLGPALLLGRYATAVGLDFGFLIQQARAELGGRVVVGGEVAADALTRHLRPGLLRLYVPEDRASDIRRKLRLAPSEEGTVELCKLYAPEIVDEPATPGRPSVDPVFIYAELMADGADRLAETALRIRQEHLKWTL
ncbi:hypothetical protein KJ567_00885, partial [Candidatus Bipolaricaulota bacterium]|nr:hypothetical protein [Candidatus Bipolaricaulota bacterium]